MDFTGKVAFITGGASGMGLATANRLLEAGASVAIFDLNPVDGERLADPSRALVLTGDAASADDVFGAVDRTMERFGRLDYGVNAAGTHGKPGPILDQENDAFDLLLHVNVRGVFLAMKAQARAMLASGNPGAIVNFASVYSGGAHRNMALYSSSKHAVVGLTKGAAIEFAEHGIRVNAILPGPVATPFLGEITPAMRQLIEQAVPQKRAAEAEEIAPIVLWLLADEGSFMTGASVDVSGGMSAQLAG